MILAGLLNTVSVFAVAKESTISINLSSGSLLAEIVPFLGGNFGESGNATVSVGTDNFTGYR